MKESKRMYAIRLLQRKREESANNADVKRVKNTNPLASNKVVLHPPSNDERNVWAGRRWMEKVRGTVAKTIIVTISRHN